jgi:hypothetical protein
VQGTAEPLQEQRAAGLVGAEQAGAAVAGGQPEHRDLVPGVVAGARDHQLQHRGLGGGDLRDERFGRVGERAADRDVPVALEGRDQPGELVQPGG